MKNMGRDEMKKKSITTDIIVDFTVFWVSMMNNDRPDAVSVYRKGYG